MSKEALKLALEALEYHTEQTRPIWKTEQTITAIKQALAAPVQEPVAWMAEPVMKSGRGTTKVFCSDKRLAEQWDYGGHPEYGRMLLTPLYTTPPAQRQWVGLTDDDIEQEFGFIDELLRDCVHRTEAKLKEKNT